MITLKDFVATNDKRPGQNRFTVTGTVVVPTPAYAAQLVKPEMRHKGGWELLHVDTTSIDKVTLQVMTERSVTFEQDSCSPFSKLEITYADGSIFIDITSIE